MPERTTYYMMRNYKRKSGRQDWSVNGMEKAIQAILSERMGVRKAAEFYGVPKSTLGGRIQKIKSKTLRADEAALKGRYLHKFTLHFMINKTFVHICKIIHIISLK